LQPGRLTAGSLPADTDATSLVAADRSQLTLAGVRGIVATTHRRLVRRHDDVTVRHAAARRLAAVVVHDALGAERTELPLTRLCSVYSV